MKIKVDVSYTEKVIYREEIIFDEEQDGFIKKYEKRVWFRLQRMWFERYKLWRFCQN